MTAPGPVEQEKTATEQLLMALAYAQSAKVVAASLSAMPDVVSDAAKALLAIGPVRGMLRTHAHQKSGHPAEEAMRAENLHKRAAYLIAASRRLSRAWRSGPRAGRKARMLKAIEVEHRYLDQHIKATAGRRLAAEAAAKEAKRVARAEVSGVFEAPSGLLGWYAVLDERTSRDCARANGRNFAPTEVPRIGFPGTVHPACRCKPGPPHPTHLRVEDIPPDITEVVAGRRRARREIAASNSEWSVGPGWTATLTP